MYYRFSEGRNFIFDFSFGTFIWTSNSSAAYLIESQLAIDKVTEKYYWFR
jgi:hypothetical protein